jgi:HAD superfamily hydrolase (TIGR01509 family)
VHYYIQASISTLLWQGWPLVLNACVKPELVIFDCDGVLVDSEPVSNRVMAEAIGEAGLAMSAQEVADAFEGMRLDDIAAEVEERIGKRLPEGWVVDFEDRRAVEFQKGVEAISGVEAVLGAIHAAGIRTCVASQASRQKMELTLGLSGLIEHFEESSLFSSRMVERGKPYPDLFLLAAGSMGSRPAGCVVIEDGVLGARAGRLAGIDVLGYAPDGKGERLAREGAKTFESMAELPSLIGLPGQASAASDIDHTRGG